MAILLQELELDKKLQIHIHVLERNFQASKRYNERNCGHFSGLLGWHVNAINCP